MGRQRVYLSKSSETYNGDYEEVKKFLKILDVEIIEHRGGTYNHDAMLTCHYLLILASNITTDPIVGKGQHDQIVEFLKKNPGKEEHVLILSDYDTEYEPFEFWDLQVRSYTDMEVLTQRSQQNWNRWAALDTSDELDMLTDVFPVNPTYEKLYEDFLNDDEFDDKRVAEFLAKEWNGSTVYHTSTGSGPKTVSALSSPDDKIYNNQDKSINTSLLLVAWSRLKR